MKKLLAILPLVLAGCAQPQPTAPTKNHRHAQPRGGILSAIRRHPGAGANAQGVSTQCKLPSANPRRRGRCGAGIIRLNRNRQGRQPGGQHPGMILLGVLRSVQQRQRLALPPAPPAAGPFRDGRRAPDDSAG